MLNLMLASCVCVGTASYKTARVSLLLKRFLEGKIKIIVGEKTF
jgi:hypothetical protein